MSDKLHLYKLTITKTANGYYDYKGAEYEWVDPRYSHDFSYVIFRHPEYIGDRDNVKELTLDEYNQELQILQDYLDSLPPVEIPVEANKEIEALKEKIKILEKENAELGEGFALVRMAIDDLIMGSILEI